MQEEVAVRLLASWVFFLKTRENLCLIVTRLAQAWAPHLISVQPALYEHG